MKGHVVKCFTESHRHLNFGTTGIDKILSLRSITRVFRHCTFKKRQNQIIFERTNINKSLSWTEGSKP